MTKSSGVREARIPRNALGQPHTMRNRHVLEKLFGAFMDVEHPELQVKNRLACYAKQEMTRLNDAGVYWPDGHLKHALAFNFAHFVAFALKGWELGPQIEIFAQRMDLRPV